MSDGAIKRNKELLWGFGVHDMEHLHAIGARQGSLRSTAGQNAGWIAFDGGAMIFAPFPQKTKGLEEVVELVHGREVGEVQTDYSKTAILRKVFDLGEYLLVLLNRIR